MTAAPMARMITSQARMELVLTMRRGESVLITVVVPALLMVFFASTNVLSVIGMTKVEFLLPGMLSLAVISSAMVSLGIATAFDRQYGTLKRLGATPLPKIGLIGAKLLSVLAIEAIQIGVLVGIALAYGWAPKGSVLEALVVLLLGTCAFSGIGLAMAGALRAEATLAGANGLFLLFLLLGGIFLPLSHLPAWLAKVAYVFPAAPFAEAMRSTLLGSTPPLLSIALLVVWAVAAPLVAALTFRWS